MTVRYRLHRRHRALPPDVHTRWSHELCAAISEAGYPIRPVRELLPERPGEWIAEPDLSTVPDDVWNKAVSPVRRTSPGRTMSVIVRRLRGRCVCGWPWRRDSHDHSTRLKTLALSQHRR